nr:helix-turn-helix transcriptional regulator [Sphingomonas sp. Y57]
MLGKLEEEVLLAALQAGEAALPSEIYARMVDAPGKSRAPAFGAVYTTLTRMTAKKLLVESAKADPGGRARRAFTVSAAGRRAVVDAMRRVHALGGFALAGV